MIQIPLEIGDTILAGRFKNKKIKVNEIGIDDFGSPTINGRSILKIRIPKLYQKQENEMKTSIKENLSPDKLKTIDKKIEWSTEKNLPFSQGSAIKEVIARYKIPAIKWGYVGTGQFIGVETNKQKMFWRDKGSELQFLGILNKDGSVAENKTLKEAVNPFQKSPLEVKIKQTDGSWHIYLQTVDGEECLTMTGWGTKEQAEHAAMTKGYSFDANKSNETPTRDTPKYTGYEKVRSEKPEEMKLSKEKTIEIKLESMMKRIMKEETASGLEPDVLIKKIFKAVFNKQMTYKNGKWVALDKDINKLTNKNHINTDFSPTAISYFISDANKLKINPKQVYNKQSSTSKSFGGETISYEDWLSESNLGKKKALNELEVTDSDLIKEVEEYASAINEIDRLMEQVKKLELRVKELDKKFVVMLEALETELGNSKDTFIRAKNILITIKKRSHDRTSFKYKEAFDWLYTRVSPQMKKLIDETLEANKTVSQVKASLSVQYEASNWLSNLYSKVKNWFVSNIKNLRSTNKIANSELDQLEKMV